MDHLFRDLRHALRSLARSPGFTAVALVTLALGTGANAAIFSVVHAVLLEPLPFAEPDRLVTVWLHNPRQGFDKDITSYPNFHDWREQGSSFSQMVGVAGTDLTLSGGGAGGGDAGAAPEEVRGALVMEGFFPMLGVAPELGRGFRDEEHEVGHHQVVVLSHGLWSRRFGADPAVEGSDIRVSGRPHTVVGVMPQGVRFPEDAQLWLPFAFTPAREELREARSALWLPVFGRLAPGVSLAEAQAEMSAVAKRLEEAYPDDNEEMGILLEPLRKTLVGDVERPLLVLLGAVGLVLLIACANVANLLLARGAARSRELAVRSALGAGGGSLARQVLAESLLLGAGGGLLGLFAAALGVRSLLGLAPGELPRMEGVAIDWTVFGFALAVALAAGVLFGLPSAFHAAGAEPGKALKEGGRGLAGGGRLGRLRQVFVAGQLALALVLLAGAGLLVRSFLELRSVDPGFDPRGVLSFRVTLPGQSYETPERITAFYRELLGSLEALPGVESAAAITDFVVARLPQSAPISIPSRPDLSQVDPFPVAYDAVTPDFFEAAGMPILRGRAPSDADRPDGARVAVVNEALARRYFPGEDALGQRFMFGTPQGDDPPWITVVGVAADARRSGLDQDVRPSAFMPHTQYSASQMTVLLRSAGDPLALAEPARRAVTALDADQPITEVRTLEQVFAGTGARRRFVAVLLGVFSGLAVALAAIGIYGVMAYVVGQRTREIGIRMALGARRREVVGWVLGQGMAVVGAGIALGLLGAVAATRLLSGLLYETAPADPVTFLLVAALLAAVAVAANLLPARRAARVDPMTVLREE
ncbi:MAG TPA: ABC transporter permease [Thermoanaerobaculia bacterium]|nr:ABC transporter permease [Thermoanaerobaculia bacterium]